MEGGGFKKSWIPKKTSSTDGTYNAVNWKTGSMDGTKNAVNLKKRENQYQTSLETYKTDVARGSVCPSFAFGTDVARSSVSFGPNQGIVMKPNIANTR